MGLDDRDWYREEIRKRQQPPATTRKLQAVHSGPPGVFSWQCLAAVSVGLLAAFILWGFA